MERTPPKSGRARRPAGTLLTAPPTVEVRATVMQPSNGRLRGDNGRFTRVLEPIASLIDISPDEEIEAAGDGLQNAFVTPAGPRYALSCYSVPSAHPSSRHTPGSALSGVSLLRNLYSIPPPASRPPVLLPPTTSSQFNCLFQSKSQPSPQVLQQPQYGQRNKPSMTETERCIKNDRRYPDFHAIQLNASTWPSTTKNLSYLAGHLGSEL
ncbi:hypothetical protein C8J56DRAFT_1063609 [Mycena floridula]|nr:hypothetical protein C8J56DRAFT_1063609 [Mycena floridula]